MNHPKFTSSGWSSYQKLADTRHQCHLSHQMSLDQRVNLGGTLGVEGPWSDFYVVLLQRQHDLRSHQKHFRSLFGWIHEYMSLPKGFKIM